MILTQKNGNIVWENKSGNKVITNSETKKLLSNGKEINLNIKIDTFIGQESFADSIGEHIWNKWMNACETHHGSLDCIAFFLLELDNSCLQKIIDRSQEYDF